MPAAFGFSSAARIMAAKCIVQQKDSPLMHELDSLSKDTTQVYVAPFGCRILKQTMGEAVAELKNARISWGIPKIRSSHSSNALDLT